MSMLPTIVWVAARPPIPPFSGITSKTLCGLRALSAQTEVDLVTFADGSLIEKIQGMLCEYWRGLPFSFHILPTKSRVSKFRAIAKRQFYSGLLFDLDLLAIKLNQLKWYSPDHLILFDDILFAPCGRKYGFNAILSPHDCMSQMFLSHFKLQPFSFAKLRKFFQYIVARKYEKEFYHYFLLVHVITQRDRILLQHINPFARYHVVPNSDLLNPGLVRDWNSPWDILIWGDLSIPSCAHGTREFLRYLRENEKLVRASTILIGKLSKKEALKILGHEAMGQIAYSTRLEDESGRIRSAKIIVIPDLGGAGIKNRIVNVLASGLCLACLISQMEGVEVIADRGAINAVTMEELVKKIAYVLDTREYERIANMGQGLYENFYNLKANYRLWREMIERALSVRKWLAVNQ